MGKNEQTLRHQHSLKMKLAEKPIEVVPTVEEFTPISDDPLPPIPEPVIVKPLVECKKCKSAKKLKKFALSRDGVRLKPNIKE